jgi:hypothetical protein
MGMSLGQKSLAAGLRRQLEETRGHLRQVQEELQGVRRELRRERLAKTRLWTELRELGLAEQLELARRCAEEFRARLSPQGRRRKA